MQYIPYYNTATQYSVTVLAIMSTLSYYSYFPPVSIHDIIIIFFFILSSGLSLYHSQAGERTVPHTGCGCDPHTGTVLHQSERSYGHQHAHSICEPLPAAATCHSRGIERHCMRCTYCLASPYPLIPHLTIILPCS